MTRILLLGFSLAERKTKQQIENTMLPQAMSLVGDR
jgi:hypothetical protein